MKLKIISFIFGTVVLKATGIFPERIINIAKEMGIFISDIERCEDGITFSVSIKGCELLFSSPLPDNLNIEVVKRLGIPSLFYNHKGRIMLFICPVAVLFLLLLSTLFIWNVNIIDADPVTEERLLNQLNALGVRRGALKCTLDPSEIKKRLLIEDESLLWIWVDIKGSGAIVRYALRTPVPSIPDENEPYNIYSTKNATVTRIIPTQGNAMVKVGDYVEKGDLLIEGIMPKNSEEIKGIHATGIVAGEVWEEKTVRIPKKNEIRTKTGEKTQHLTIKISNFPLKLFINSSILYENYDIIISNRSLSFLPVTFNKVDYEEVLVDYEENDITAECERVKNDFINSFYMKSISVNNVLSDIQDKGDYVLFTVRLLCEEHIAEERRIFLGEDNTVTND